MKRREFIAAIGGVVIGGQVRVMRRALLTRARVGVLAPGSEEGHVHRSVAEERGGIGGQ